MVADLVRGCEILAKDPEARAIDPTIREPAFLAQESGGWPALGIFSPFW
jgi:hypothetical protein